MLDTQAILNGFSEVKKTPYSLLELVAATKFTFQIKVSV